MRSKGRGLLVRIVINDKGLLVMLLVLLVNYWEEYKFLHSSTSLLTTVLYQKNEKSPPINQQFLVKLKHVWLFCPTVQFNTSWSFLADT